MKILPIYDTRKNKNIALKNSNNYYLKLLSEQNENVNTSQNVNFRGFLDLFKRERNFFTTLEATKLLNDAGIKEPNVLDKILKSSGNNNIYDFKLSKLMIQNIVKLINDGFDIEDLIDRNSKYFTPKNIQSYVDKLYKIKQAGYKIEYIPEFVQAELPSEEENNAIKTLLEILEEGYKHRDELSYPSYVVEEDEITDLFLNDPLQTLDTIKLLGKKDFINTFSEKYDNVENNIQNIGAIDTEHPLIENLLELTNPQESSKYKENKSLIKKLKKQFNTTQDKTQLIKEINRLTDENKNLIAKSIKAPSDKTKIAHIFHMMEKDSKKLQYVLKYCNSNTKDSKLRFNKLINEVLRTDENGNVCKQLDFRKNKFLVNLCKSDEYFRETFNTLLKALNKSPFNSPKEIFYDFPMTQNVKKQFKRLGLNFDNWFSASKSNIQKEIKLDNTNRKQHIIKNLEDDFSDEYFQLIPKNEFNKLETAIAKNGFEFKEQESVNYDIGGFINGTKISTRLFKNNKPVAFEDLPNLFKILSGIMKKDKFWISKNPDNAIENAKATFKNHILTMRYKEMLSAGQKTNENSMKMTVRKVDMNDVEYALFLGNHAGCCTAVGSGFNQWTAPNYVMCKMISAIEILDGKEPIGNTMCYIAEIDKKPSLVLDNIELQARYQYNDEIRDSIFDYAKKLTEEIGQPDMPIYAGPNRHKVNMENFPIENKDFRIIGSSGDEQLYFDFDAEAHAIDGTEVFNSELYKIR